MKQETYIYTTEEKKQIFHIGDKITNYYGTWEIKSINYEKSERDITALCLKHHSGNGAGVIDTLSLKYFKLVKNIKIEMEW